ncbi:MAG: hypothetical protein CMI29_10635 [Opitutae bacterium]|nr:hypothetical protein [Opitutae bacterium]|tara:strand:- start:9223 stop:9957 length:735 start_codon:yes stop_codon:yes gene_type:complete
MKLQSLSFFQLFMFPVTSLFLTSFAPAAEIPKWVDLFNGKDLDGWVDVNTSPDTWFVKDGILICKGKPIGVMRSEKQYENFLLHVEWRHMEPGGNSGIFAWSDAIPFGNRLPKGLEIQMLELDWVKLRTKKGKAPPPIAYVHGELFGAGGLKATPDNPRGSRSKSLENRCKGRGQWNVYDVVCVDGVVKLSVNGKFVNGIRNSQYKKGYLCLESEGAEIHFRNLKIMELPPGVTSPEQTAPLAE